MLQRRAIHVHPTLPANNSKWRAVEHPSDLGGLAVSQPCAWPSRTSLLASGLFLMKSGGPMGGTTCSMLKLRKHRQGRLSRDGQTDRRRRGGGFLTSCRAPTRHPQTADTHTTGQPVRGFRENWPVSLPCLPACLGFPHTISVP